MKRSRRHADVIIVVLLIGLVVHFSAYPVPEENRVGPLGDGRILVPNGQVIKPAGQALAFKGRPVDVALSPDVRTLFAKDDRGLIVVDAAAWIVKQELPFPKDGGGGS